MGFFGTWPFDVLGTTRDTLDVFDATQLKRISLVLAAGAHRIASASKGDVLEIAETFVRRGKIRLLEASREAVPYKLDRELRALETLARLEGAELSPFRDQLLDAGSRKLPADERSSIFGKTGVLEGPLTEELVPCTRNVRWPSRWACTLISRFSR